MNNQVRQIKYFFFSHYFSDGLRITFGILLPALLFSWLGHLETGLTLSLGALCVSIVDSPGPVAHKRNAMFYCSLFTFAVALLTGYSRLNVYVLGIEVLLLSFFFSMFAVYGNRAAALGTAVLLVMVLMMDKALQPAEVPGYSALILGGGLWYMLLSLLFFQIMPYRQAQQALGECIHEIANFLRLKQVFYSGKFDADREYTRLVTQQVVVSQKQDAVRELLFKSRQLVKESTTTSRTLFWAFVDVVDLYEQTTASHYDYSQIQERFGDTGVLAQISDIIKQIADELDDVGVAIQSNTRYRMRTDITLSLERLKEKIDAVGERSEGSNLVLKKILINLRQLTRGLADMRAYFSAGAAASPHQNSKVEYTRFVSHEQFSVRKFLDNLTFSSSVFKHAFRVALVCLFGFVVTKLFTFGHHSYWVLLTIIVILKPGFSLTKERNFQRMVGTIIGGFFGVVILYLLPDKTAQFVLLMFLMVGTYSFMRINYIISVMFMTPYIIILFSFLGIGHLDLVEERVVDTLIGSAIAFAASYFVFPSWESDRIKALMYDMLQANGKYLLRLAESLSGKEVAVIDYRLARKDVYVSAANLSGAFQRMLSEPKHTQRNTKEVHKFVVLNHILSSNIATLSSAIIDQEGLVLLAPENLRPVKKALASLNEGMLKLEPQASANTSESINLTLPASAPPEGVTTTDISMDEQLKFIQKLSNELSKITDCLA